MYPLTALRVVQAYAVLLALVALGGLGVFGYSVWQLIGGQTFAIQTEVQVFLLIPSAVIFFHLAYNMLRRREEELVLLTPVLYSLILMTAVILASLLWQYGAAILASSTFLYFVLLLLFLLVSAYLFSFNKAIKHIFKKDTALQEKAE